MLILEIFLFIILVLSIGYSLTKAIDNKFKDTPTFEQITDITTTNTPQNTQPLEIDVLIAIDRKLATQNRHLSAIRSSIGWLLAIAILPFISSIIGIIILFLVLIGAINIF